MRLHSLSYVENMTQIHIFKIKLFVVAFVAVVIARVVIRTVAPPDLRELQS